MAVKHVETFTFELPLEAIELPGTGVDHDPSQTVVGVTMGREALSTLWHELGVALDYVGTGPDRPFPEPEDPYAQARIDMADDEPDDFTEPVVGRRLSVEEAAAQAQIASVQAARQAHTASPHQPRGSAIGNSHV